MTRTALAVSLALTLLGAPFISGCAGGSTTTPKTEEPPAEAMADDANQKEEAPAEPEPTPEPTDETADDPVVIEGTCVKVTMPAQYATLGLSWVEHGDLMRLEYAFNGERVYIAEIAWDERAALAYEIKENRWHLGQAVVSGSVRDVVLHVPFVDQDGKTFYGGLEVDGAVLAPEYYLGLSPTEILSWIEVKDDELMPSTTADGLSTRRVEFCGVWAYASTNLGEAVAFAEDARQRGFEAEVFLTTDWANLNSDPWYVVSLGCPSSESAAVSVLENARYAGYDDAYIKWSGAYVG